MLGVMRGRIWSPEISSPRSAQYRQACSVVQATEVGRWRRNQAPVAVARVELAQPVVSQPVLGEKGQHAIRAAAVDVVIEQRPQQPLRCAGQQRRAGPFLEPAGQTEVVGVEVRDQDAPQRRVQPLQQALPDRSDRIAGKPGIDQGPAGAVA